MPMFRKKPIIVEANQFHHAATSPVGVRTREDGKAYVLTAHNQEVTLEPGDWVIAEPDGRGYYPCKDDIFKATYEPFESDKKDWRIGLSCRPRLRTSEFYYEGNGEILDVLPGGKNGILKIKINGKTILCNADDWVTA